MGESSGDFFTVELRFMVIVGNACGLAEEGIPADPLETSWVSIRDSNTAACRSERQRARACK